MLRACSVVWAWCLVGAQATPAAHQECNKEDTGQCAEDLASLLQAHGRRSPGTAAGAAEPTRALELQARLSSNGSAAPSTASFAGLGRGLVPPDGKSFLGFLPQDSPEQLGKRFVAAGGFQPAAFGTFIHTPMRDSDRRNLQAFMDEAQGAIVVVTAEPFEFEKFGASDAEELAGFCQRYEQTGGAGCIIRFMHEMNGAWYPWCQKPSLFKNKFRLMAAKIYEATSRSGMVWSVNGGDGYPFAGSEYQAQPWDPWYHELDTNNDGVVNIYDDMYAPFYPGDDVVDWVGITLYHWGDAYPWGENELPEVNAFSDKMRGHYNGAGGDMRAVPDFYWTYCGDGPKKKPLILTETSALYVEGAPFGGTASEMDMKRNWWKQVYGMTDCAPSTLCGGTQFRQLKLVMWFDYVKQEAVIEGNTAKWGFTADSRLTRQFVQDVLGQPGARERYVGLEYLTGQQ